MIPDQMGVTPDVDVDVEADGFHTIHCTGAIPIVGDDDVDDDGPDCGA